MDCWKCTQCGILKFDEEAPTECPSCGASGEEVFQRDAPASVGVLTLPTEERTWRCEVCAYEERGVEPPEICPDCGVDRTFFYAVSEAAS